MRATSFSGPPSHSFPSGSSISMNGPALPSLPSFAWEVGPPQERQEPVCPSRAVGTISTGLSHCGAPWEEFRALQLIPGNLCTASWHSACAAVITKAIVVGTLLILSFWLLRHTVQSFILSQTHRKQAMRAHTPARFPSSVVFFTPFRTEGNAAGIMSAVQGLCELPQTPTGGTGAFPLRLGFLPLTGACPVWQSGEHFPSFLPPEFLPRS